MSFDPQAYLDQSTTEALTKRPPIPPGSELNGTITSIESRQWQGKQDPSKSGIAVDVKIELDLQAYPQIFAIVGTPKVTLQDSIMLDLTEGGQIDWSPGKNSKLRRYRESLGMNTAGQSFSIRQMQGRTIKVKVKNEPYEGEVYDRIDSIAKAS